MARMHDFDWTAHRTTWNRWWAHDLPRPIVMTQTQTTAPPDRPAWWGCQLPGVPAGTTAAEIAAAAEADLLATEFHGDAFPKYWLNFGPGSLAACLGCGLHATPETTWFTPGIHAGKAIADVTVPEMGGPWLQRIAEVGRACLERFGRRAVVSFSDFGGNLDIVASMRDSQQLLMDLMDDPAEVDRLQREVTARWWTAYQAELAMAAPYGMGTSPWAPIWSEKRCYMLQSDFCYMISPKQFARWVVPDLADICTRIPHGFYHLDGKGELPHLDNLLAVPGLQGVQWIPGDGNPCSADPHWRSVLTRIRAAGKLVQLYSPGSAMLKLAAEMPTDGFVLATWSDIPGLDNAALVAAIQREAEATRRHQRPMVAVA
jgi:hypothetical protein